MATTRTIKKAYHISDTMGVCGRFSPQHPYPKKLVSFDQPFLFVKKRLPSETRTQTPKVDVITLPGNDETLRSRPLPQGGGRGVGNPAPKALRLSKALIS